MLTRTNHKFKIEVIVHCTAGACNCFSQWAQCKSIETLKATPSNNSLQNMLKMALMLLYKSEPVFNNIRLYEVWCLWQVNTGGRMFHATVVHNNHIEHANTSTVNQIIITKKCEDLSVNSYCIVTYVRIKTGESRGLLEGSPWIEGRNKYGRSCIDWRKKSNHYYWCNESSARWREWYLVF